jgi:hypothetical protein
MQHGNLYPRRIRRPNHLNQNYFDAGLAAGAAAFSSLAGVLFAGCAAFLTSASFLTSALAGAEAGVAGALAGSAANAVNANANADTIVAISAFILISF